MIDDDSVLDDARCVPQRSHSFEARQMTAPSNVKKRMMGVSSSLEQRRQVSIRVRRAGREQTLSLQRSRTNPKHLFDALQASHPQILLRMTQWFHLSNPWESSVLALLANDLSLISLGLISDADDATVSNVAVELAQGGVFRTIFTLLQHEMLHHVCLRALGALYDATPPFHTCADRGSHLAMVISLGERLLERCFMDNSEPAVHQDEESSALALHYEGEEEDVASWCFAVRCLLRFEGNRHEAAQNSLFLLLVGRLASHAPHTVHAARILAQLFRDNVRGALALCQPEVWMVLLVKIAFHPGPSALSQSHVIDDERYYSLVALNAAVDAHWCHIHNALVVEVGEQGVASSFSTCSDREVLAELLRLLKHFDVMVSTHEVIQFLFSVFVKFNQLRDDVVDLIAGAPLLVMEHMSFLRDELIPHYHLGGSRIRWMPMLRFLTTLHRELSCVRDEAAASAQVMDLMHDLDLETLAVEQHDISFSEEEKQLLDGLLELLGVSCHGFWGDGDATGGDWAL